MAIVKKATNILKRLKRDESGMAAISWALSLTAIIGAMGAAMDFAMLSSADARSQTIADTTALSAAIHMKNFEQVPQDREKGLIGDYTANELGYDYRNWVIDGADGVSVNVAYDNVKREATATVVGFTQPTLVQILGFGKLKFKAQTVVKYYEKDLQDPASIVMVLDNSGSMHFDDIPVDPITKELPDGATVRMDGLKTSAKNFMANLEAAVGPQTYGGAEPAVLRTGMMAFDSGIVRTVPMNWGYVADSHFDSMTPLAATNSAPPLTAAKTWLTVTEPPIHEANLPGKTPLKYIILMTDGKNTIGDEEWVAREGTQNWRAEVAVETTTTETQMVEVTVTVPATEGETRRRVVYAYMPNSQCRWDDGYRRRNYTYFGSWGSYRTYYDTDDRVTCNVTSEGTPAYETTEMQEREVEVTTTTMEWQYREQEDEPTEPGDWEEGEFDITSNIQTREECDSLHAAGVEVFTVGFALTPGQFGVNNWPGNWAYPDHYPADVDPFTGEAYTNEIGETNANQARAILQYCASKPENFITAADSTALDAAFDRIGNTIVKEIIRISS